eukprot:TRINITY_DN112575_c0_g1_i1.p1 TRINITY_DN112575_c0_g1~~TRINITY_DN112575_c0_g1_i1.p1  ORF type:complete len:877 (-),score=212.43 TRINITY_DN112575_c0_g1_i1:513-3143(-)
MRPSGGQRSGMFLPPPGSAASAVAAGGGGGGGGCGSGKAMGGKGMSGMPRPPAAAGSSSLLAEMKLKQDQRDRRRQLREEIDGFAASGSTDVVRLARMRTELAQVEGFLARTDGLHGQVKANETNTAPAVRDELLTTNLYVGSLTPHWTEEMLGREFGKFGGITSIKIMYPRTEQQRWRGLNSGFVQYRTRQQAEAARAAMNGKEYFGLCLRVDWGKQVQTAPAYGAQANLMPTQPAGMQVPQSPFPQGMPQQDAAGSSAERKSRWNVAKTIVVVPPESVALKRFIDRTAEYVSAEGWDFEKLLLEKEKDNSRFAFMKADNADDPLHVYYRWRVFAYFQGDTDDIWRTDPFQIYENGPLWQAPPCAKAAQEVAVMPTIQRIDMSQLKAGEQPGKKTYGGIGGADLTAEDLRVLNSFLSGLTMNRASILSAMAFCLDNSTASQEISSRICGSITDAQPGVDAAQLSARLCLLSDVLHNSHCSRPGASMYRRQFQECLPDVFEKLRQFVDTQSSKIAASLFRDTCSKLLQLWMDWSSFPPLFTKGLEATLCAPPADSQASVSDAVKKKQYQWAVMQDPAALERSCRQRGLSTKGSRQQLVERLSTFEAYWQMADAEFASKEEPVRIDPELDGDALTEEDLKLLESAPEQARQRCSIPLLPADLRRAVLGEAIDASQDGVSNMDNQWDSQGKPADAAPPGQGPTDIFATADEPDAPMRLASASRSASPSSQAALQLRSPSVAQQGEDEEEDEDEQEAGPVIIPAKKRTTTKATSASNSASRTSNGTTEAKAKDKGNAKRHDKASTEASTAKPKVKNKKDGKEKLKEVKETKNTAVPQSPDDNNKAPAKMKEKRKKEEKNTDDKKAGRQRSRSRSRRKKH